MNGTVAPVEQRHGGGDLRRRADFLREALADRRQGEGRAFAVVDVVMQSVGR